MQTSVANSSRAIQSVQEGRSFLAFLMICKCMPFEQDALLMQLRYVQRICHILAAQRHTPLTDTRLLAIGVASRSIVWCYSTNDLILHLHGFFTHHPAFEWHLRALVSTLVFACNWPGAYAIHRLLRLGGDIGGLGFPKVPHVNCSGCAAA
ncbi:uncharacterized protein LAESUDRAFT_71611 [Laetiporus sulphureus 93-53]|uniref:Uncharacterized protein n=1 Tax=Laetiporus sulphureus 93-53 TaxID=1314785 RepID=A0A165AW41_9APHY|nr:uncharacterized protein LAESUDRAFT_71611 [Laetiporus sulphureus 93-53]KZS99769.1 hypothetical protein LAESUDRAFT_71611 [Laetiporus sulphureus 93-53]